MKVFIGFADVAGFASRLGSQLAQAGHEVCWINSAPNPFNPDAPEIQGMRELAPRYFRFSKRLKDKVYPLYVLFGPVLLLCRAMIYLAALLRSEVAVFLGCGSLLPGYLDRKLAGWLGRRTINVYLGSASRPVFMGGSGLRMAEQSDKQLRKLAKKLRRQRRRVRQIAEICDEIVENPLCSQFQTRPCVDWFRLGFPSGGELFEVEEVPPRPAGDSRVTVLHCPSKPRVKGTERIRGVIKKLRGEGHPIDYVEITGMAHRDVLKNLARCDLVVDELYSDSPLAGFSSEAAFFAKPAVVGGYGWDLLEELDSAEWIAPSARCRPDELEATVLALATDQERRVSLGLAAQRYDKEFLGSPGYAVRFEKVLRGEVPDEWRFDPRELQYFHGFGQEEEDLRAGLRHFVLKQGVEALCLEDRPDLQAALEKFLQG